MATLHNLPRLLLSLQNSSTKPIEITMKRTGRNSPMPIHTPGNNYNRFDVVEEYRDSSTKKMHKLGVGRAVSKDD